MADMSPLLGTYTPFRRRYEMSPTLQAANQDKSPSPVSCKLIELSCTILLITSFMYTVNFAAHVRDNTFLYITELTAISFWSKIINDDVISLDRNFNSATQGLCSTMIERFSLSWSLLTSIYDAQMYTCAGIMWMMNATPTHFAFHPFLNRTNLWELSAMILLINYELSIDGLKSDSSLNSVVIVIRFV